MLDFSTFPLNNKVFLFLIPYARPNSVIRSSKKTRCTAVIIGVATFIFASFGVSAAELRGKILAFGGGNPPSGAVMYAECKGTQKHASVASDGRYSIRGLPSGTTCELSIAIGDAKSPRIPFTTSGPVARFNGQVRRRGNSLVLIPD